MRLSEAMMLGDVLLPRDPGVFLIPACGCALGRALKATGFSKEFGYSEDIESAWPWLNMPDCTDHCADIGVRFSEVCKGEKTFEQLVDYVRSIEPECGDCNRFDCTCKPVEVQVEEHAHA